MQRCLFFIILLCLYASGQAQTLRVAETEISFWFKSLTDREIPARAEIRFTSLENQPRLNFTANSLHVQEVRLREGRLKDKLPFRQTENELVIEMPGGFKKGTAYHISIGYKLRHDSLLHHHSWRTGAGYAVFNPFNIKLQENLGHSGDFFPSLSGEGSVLSFNITAPKGVNLELPAATNFTTNNLDGSMSHFFTSTKPLPPEAFYLVLGRYEEEELLATVQEEPLAAYGHEKLQAKVVEAKVEQAQKALGIENLSDSEYVRLDSLADMQQPEFYISHKDLPGISTEQFRLNKSLFMEYAGDTQKQLYHYYREHIGEQWHQKMLEQKWRQYDTLPTDEKRMTLGFVTENYRRENDFVWQLDQEELDSGFYAPLSHSLELPAVQVNYRYVHSQQQLWIIVQQDTARAPGYSLPARAYLLHRGDSLGKTAILNRPVDTLRLSATGAPAYAHLDFGAHFPGTVKQQKPETYWLHQLTTTRGEEKTIALRELFNTANKNLRSTVLGIAMDDPDADIRLEAVLAADDLNQAGRQKLKDTLLQMAAEDPSAEVQQAARKLTAKYYPAK